LGVDLTEKNAPRLAALLRRLVPDMVAAYSAPKDAYRRQRPYLRDEGPICVDRSPALDTSWDYPSGHATFAWTAGLVLAELAPDRAGPLLARARAFGESRAVCGVHSASAVAEARTAGSVLVAALHGDEPFRKDMEAARAEIAALRRAAAPQSAEICRAETSLTAKTPW
jgi:acid phosphatase (class A)